MVAVLIDAVDTRGIRGMSRPASALSVFVHVGLSLFIHAAHRTVPNGGFLTGASPESANNRQHRQRRGDAKRED